MKVCHFEKRSSSHFCILRLALLVTHLTTTVYKWQGGVWNAASVWRWMFSASAHGLICLASAPLTSWHMPWGLSLYEAGVRYLEPDLYTNTHTNGEGAMTVLFPCHSCQQYNHLPTLQCVFKDSIQKERGKEISSKQTVILKAQVNRK